MKSNRFNFRDKKAVLEDEKLLLISKMNKNRIQLTNNNNKKNFFKKF